MPKYRHCPHGNRLHVRMHYKHGAYWYVYQGKWDKLGKSYQVAMQSYAAWIAPSGGMAKLVDDTYQYWERRVDKGLLAPRSLKQYKTVRERITTAFEDFSPEQVKPSHIGQFIDFYLEDSPSQGNIALIVLRAAFTRGVRHGLCDMNPAREIKREEIPKRSRHLTDDEFRAIRQALPVWCQVVMDMCYLTAQRIGDVLDIKQADITEEGIYFQQQKTKKRLLIETSPELEALVVEARGLSKVAGVYLFTKKPATHRSYSSVLEHFQAACKAARVENARIHDIRAKALTDADAEGMDAQKLGGHSTRAQTENYLRLLRTDRAKSPSKVANFRRSLEKHG